MILPDLSNETLISLDIETRDPDLLTLGPGVRRDKKENYILGVSIAGEHTPAQYISFGHPSGNTHTKEEFVKWAKKELTRNQPKTGANLLYDLDWLGGSAIKVLGPIWDTQIAEPLLNENKGRYGLDYLAEEYFGESIYQYPDFKIKLIAYKVRWVTGKIKSTSHDLYKWIKINDIDNYDFAEADKPLVKKLKKEMI